jgi:hypothetical protein
LLTRKSREHPSGITLGLERGELGAHFTDLGGEGRLTLYNIESKDVMNRRQGALFWVTFHFGV